MRCDAYCFTRARTFFDSVAVFGADGEVHGMLAESIMPNDDSRGGPSQSATASPSPTALRSMPTR